jgi:hypothetical protein
VITGHDDLARNQPGCGFLCRDGSFQGFGPFHVAMRVYHRATVTLPKVDPRGSVMSIGEPGLGPVTESAADGGFDPDW